MLRSVPPKLGLPRIGAFPDGTLYRVEADGYLHILTTKGYRSETTGNDEQILISVPNRQTLGHMSNNVETCVLTWNPKPVKISARDAGVTEQEFGALFAELQRTGKAGERWTVGYFKYTGKPSFLRARDRWLSEKNYKTFIHLRQGAKAGIVGFGHFDLNQCDFDFIETDKLSKLEAPIKFTNLAPMRKLFLKREDVQAELQNADWGTQQTSGDPLPAIELQQINKMLRPKMSLSIQQLCSAKLPLEKLSLID